MKKKNLEFIPPEPPERILATAEEGLTQEQARQRQEDGWANTPLTEFRHSGGAGIRLRLSAEPDLPAAGGGQSTHRHYPGNSGQEHPG